MLRCLFNTYHLRFIVVVVATGCQLAIILLLFLVFYSYEVEQHQQLATPTNLNFAADAGVVVVVDADVDTTAAVAGQHLSEMHRVALSGCCEQVFRINCKCATKLRDCAKRTSVCVCKSVCLLDGLDVGTPRRISFPQLNRDCSQLIAQRTPDIIANGTDIRCPAARQINASQTRSVCSGEQVVGWRAAACEADNQLVRQEEITNHNSNDRHRFF